MTARVLLLVPGGKPHSLDECRTGQPDLPGRPPWPLTAALPRPHLDCARQAWARHSLGAPCVIKTELTAVGGKRCFLGWRCEPTWNRPFCFSRRRYRPGNWSVSGVGPLGLLCRLAVLQGSWAEPRPEKEPEPRR